MKLSIRWALILGFLTLIWGTYVITTTSTFISSQEVLDRHARDIMENIADLAMEQSQNHLAHAHGAAALTRRLISANVVSSHHGNFDGLEQYFLDQLATYAHFAGIYLGKPNGDFFYVSRNEDRSPGGFRTKIVAHTGDRRQTHLIWRDSALRRIAEEPDPADTYDPRLRPWYARAEQQEAIVWTDPYIFFTSQKPGITIAGPVYGESGQLSAVVGVDIEIDQLSAFIKHLNIGKNGRAFMINNNGDVVAFPEIEKIRTNGDGASRRLVKIDELDDALSRKAFAAIQVQRNAQGRYRLEGSRFAKFDHGGRMYHAMLTPFSIEQWPWIVGVYLPEDDYLGALKENRRHNVLLTLGISLVATLFALLLSRSIIGPIADLEKAALAVKNDDLQARWRIHTRYKEIDETARAFARMKNAIRESQERYRGIFENIQDVYYETDMNGVILELSPSIEAVAGYRRENLIGSNVRDYYADPVDRESLVNRLLASRQVRDYEIVLKGFPEGTRNHFSLNSVLMADAQGNPVKIIGSMRNITEKKRAEQELHAYRVHLEELVRNRTHDLETANRQLRQEIKQRLRTEAELSEREEKYRNILDSIEEGYFETDLRGTLRFFNDATTRILGRSREELLGAPLRRYVQRAVAVELFPVFKRLYQSATPLKAVPVEIVRKDAQKRYIELSASLMRGADGRPTGFRGLGRDLTDRRREEIERRDLEEKLQQSQRLKSLGRLAGGIAHDFNNLLMGIQGNASLLMMQIDQTHPLHPNVKAIERCVQNGTNLTRQLLGYARGGKYVVIPTNLNELVRKTADLFSRTKKEIAVALKLEDRPWTVNVDRSQIEQVLLNLYLNAWQSMNRGGTLTLKTENVQLGDGFVQPFEARPGKYLKLAVTDTGTGMDEDTQRRVFEPFFTTRSMGRGTGLGLASAFGIVKNHDGIITFDSRVGKGTTFYVYLPAVDKTAESDRPKDRGAPRANASILVVDDEAYILDACRGMLQRLGYRVHTAGGGAEAIETFKRHRPGIDLVILDIIMPGMDGLETYRQLKRIDPGIRILLASGYSIDDVSADGAAPDPDAFIQKPFTIDEIDRKINRLLDTDGQAR